MLKHYQKAFTLIEVTVTIVIISIIATISIVGYTSIQRETRDSSRSSKTTVVSEALERYYAKNNEYPGVASIAGKDIATVKQKLNILSDDALVFPLASNSTSSISTTPSTSKLAYAGGTTDPANNSQCQTDPNGYCDAYQLVYVRESDNQSVTVQSRRNSTVAITDPMTPAAPTQPAVVGAKISASLVRFTASSASCSIGTVQYKIRYNTTSTLPAWTTVSWLSGTTVDINPGTDTTFYSQSLARCVSGTQNSPDSINSTTDLLDFTPAPPPGSPPSTPSVSASALSTSSIRVTWPAASGATSYAVRYGTASASTLTGCSASPCDITGLASGTLYYVSVTASNSYGSSVGNSQTTTSSPPATPATPAAVTVTTGASTSTTTAWSWTTGSCNIGTSEYEYTLSATSGSASPITTTSTSVSLTTSSQGYIYTLSVRTRCNNSGVYSAWSTSASASYTRPVTAEIIITNGSMSLYEASSTTAAIWGGSSVTGFNTTCPSTAPLGIRYQVRKNNAIVQDSGSWGTSTSGSYNVDLDLNDMLEFQWGSICKNATSGVQGNNNWSDIFGNGTVTVNRQYNTVRGKWTKTCGGGSPATYDTVCTPMPETAFGTFT